MKLTLGVYHQLKHGGQSTNTSTFMLPSFMDFFLSKQGQFLLFPSPPSSPFPSLFVPTKYLVACVVSCMLACWMCNYILIVMQSDRLRHIHLPRQRSHPRAEPFSVLRHHLPNGEGVIHRVPFSVASLCHVPRPCHAYLLPRRVCPRILSCLCVPG